MKFQGDGLPLLIGSLPLKSHEEATRMVLHYTPEIPLWVQLPSHPEDRLLTQFSEGLPGLQERDGTLFIDTSSPEFEAELLAFYEEYLAVTEGGMPLEGTRFALSPGRSKGLDALLDAVEGLQVRPKALKGQITGPFTMLTGLKDQAGKALFGDPQLRDAVVKMVALKGRYQIEKLGSASETVILFLDEPGLTGFGSSAMVGISKEEVIQVISEVVEEAKKGGAVVGVHVCGNTDWDLIFRCSLDIVSFDAFGFLDRMLLFRSEIGRFMEAGGTMAWGIVPTLDPDALKATELPDLKSRWEQLLQGLGLDADLVVRHSLITPSCGTGLLTPELSEKALRLTRELSLWVRGADEG